MLLPTPTTSEATGIGEHGRGGMNLRTFVSKMLSGHEASDASGNGNLSRADMLPGLGEFQAE